ncbi:uncharacterized protein V1516DRAFT_284897 [Lipomyces oligophaga]|uniref:uncharacterized protein n=1 Tax=Lipomyces oligophaga TaxID=45792 RepID=UPI0034CE3765
MWNPETTESSTVSTAPTSLISSTSSTLIYLTSSTTSISSTADNGIWTPETTISSLTTSTSSLSSSADDGMWHPDTTITSTSTSTSTPVWEPISSSSSSPTTSSSIAEFTESSSSLDDWQSEISSSTVPVFSTTTYNDGYWTPVTATTSSAEDVAPASTWVNTWSNTWAESSSTVAEVLPTSTSYPVVSISMSSDNVYETSSSSTATETASSSSSATTAVSIYESESVFTMVSSSTSVEYDDNLWVPVETVVVYETLTSTTRVQLTSTLVEEITLAVTDWATVTAVQANKAKQTPTTSSSLSFATSSPSSLETASATQSSDTSSESGSVSACPIEGASCAVHGEVACNGYSWGQCVWGVWVVRQCSTGLACFSATSGDVYCDYPGATAVTSCLVGEKGTGLSVTKRSADPKKMMRRRHLRQRRSTTAGPQKRHSSQSPFFDAEMGRKFAPHVPVRRSLVVEEQAEKPHVRNIVRRTVNSGGPSVLQGVTFDPSSSDGSTSASSSSSTTDTSSDEVISVEASDGTNYIIRISTQTLSDDKFSGTLYAAPLSNNPIGKNWSFTLVSKYSLDSVNRGSLTQIDDETYTISSIEEQEANKYMAIRVTFTGTLS